MMGVIAEAVYATIAVRPILSDQLSEASSIAGTSEMTYSTLFWFHLPLAGTSVLALIAQPLVTSSLARLANPICPWLHGPLFFK